MKLNPQQAPLYGECVLTVVLEEDEAYCPVQDARRGAGGSQETMFYLLFSGSTLRHLTTTLRVSHVTLQAVCPAHDTCEQVVVTLCVARPDGRVDPQSQQHFYYVPDLALDMAHYLLSNGEPQGVMLLDEQQVPLQECEKLDRSLALALRHLTSPRPRAELEPEPELGPQKGPAAKASAERGNSVDADRDKPGDASRELAVATESHAVAVAVAVAASSCMEGLAPAGENADLTGEHTADQEDAAIDVSQWEGHRWSALLQFAASRGLRRVARFLLRQPAAREALGRRDARGDTPAGLARRKGHQQLAELFTRYEASPAAEDLQEESEGCLQVYPEGRAFQCHPGLGTYTLTLLTRRGKEKEKEKDKDKEEQREEGERGGGGQRSESLLLQSEVEELRRLVHIHREQKRTLDFCGSSSPASGSAFLSSLDGLGCPAGGACPESNGQSESQEPVQLAVEAPAKCCKATEIQAPDRGSAVPDIASGNTGSPRPVQEEKGLGRASPVSGRHPTRNRKNKKRTSKNSGNDKIVPRTPDKAINNPPETTGSNSKELNSILAEELLREEKATSPSTPERTPFPIVPLHGTECNAAQVVVTTSIAEKQEGGNSELCLETSARETKRREDLTAKQTNQNHRSSNACTEAQCNLPSKDNTQRKESMGQGQSLDADTDAGDPSVPGPRDQIPGPGQGDSPKSPGGRPRRMLWRDGGWIGAMAPSAQPGPEEALAKTVWYQEESPERPPAEGASLPLQGSDDRTQYIGYGENTAEDPSLTSLQSDNGLPEVSEPGESAPSRPDASAFPGVWGSVDPEACFSGLVSALSQAGASGAQPAASHVPGAQRQEASEEQRGQGGRGAGEAGRKERAWADLDDRRRANSEGSLERGEAEQGPEEEATEETTDKGRKKRRRKRVRRGGAEAKLSSSSSTESHVLMDTQADAPTPPPQISSSPTAETQAEIQAPADRVRDLRVLGGGAVGAEGLEATQTVVQAVAGRAGSRPPYPGDSVSVFREEADACTMRLPSQTEGKTTHCSTTVVAPADTDPCSPAHSLALVSTAAEEAGEVLHSDAPDFDLTEPVELNICVQPVELNTPAGIIDLTVSDLKVDPLELDYRHSDATPPKGAFNAVLTPEQSAEAVPADLYKCSQSEDLEAKPRPANCSVDPLPLCVTRTDTAGPTDAAAKLSESAAETSACTAASQGEEARAAAPPPQRAGEGPADVSPFKTQEGTADRTATMDSGHCFGRVEPTHSGPSEGKPSEEKGSEVGEGNEEMREACLMERQSDGVSTSRKSCLSNVEQSDAEGTVGSRAEVQESGENENHREAGSGRKIREGNVRYNEELTATAVAVVTVAVASALANIELRQRVTGAQTDVESSQVSSLEVNTGSRPLLVVRSEDHLPLDTTAQVSWSENQFPNYSKQQRTATPPPCESHHFHDLSDTDDYHSSNDDVSGIVEDQPGKVKERQDKGHVLPGQGSVPEAHVDVEQSPEANILNKFVAEPISTPYPCSGLDQDLTLIAVRTAQVDTETSRTLNELPAANPARPTPPQSEGQPCPDDRGPLPIVDTGQGDGELLDQFDSNADTENPEFQECTDDSPGDLGCSLSEDPWRVRVYPEPNATVPLIAQFLQNESYGASQSQELSPARAGQACEAGQRCAVLFVCEEGEAVGAPEDAPADGQRSPSELCVSECSLPACEAVLSVNGDLLPSGTALSNSPHEEPASTGTPGGGTSRPLADMFVSATPMEFQSSSFHHEGDRSAVMRDGDDTFRDQGGYMGYLDAVDGCQAQDRISYDEGKQRIMVTAQDVSERRCSEKAAPADTETIPEGPPATEIQRDKETFFPLGPCPEPCTLQPVSSTPAAPVSDLGLSGPWEADDHGGVPQVRPTTPHDAADRPTPGAELDDCVFKKPAPPGPRTEFRERRVRSSWSSTDDSSLHGPPSVSSLHSLDTASMDTASMDTSSIDTASMDGSSVSESGAPWSPGGPWKSEKEGCIHAGGQGVDSQDGEEGEKEDSLPDNPVTSAILRASNRSLSPLRRHSWESGRAIIPGPLGDQPPAQRSSQRILPVEVRRAKPPLHRRSFSLEGLEVARAAALGTAGPRTGAFDRDDRSGTKGSRLEHQERGGGSLVSLTEEEQEGDASSPVGQSAHRVSMETSCPASSHHQPLTKSISMVAISQRETDANGRPQVKRRISFSLSISPIFPKTRSLFSIGSFSSDDEGEGGRIGSFSTTSGSLEYSICEEEPGPLRSSIERGGGAGGVAAIGGTKVSRTFSYLRNKMSKKNKGSDREKKGEKEREGKERDKRPMSGHALSPTTPPPGAVCQQCPRLLLAKDTFFCTNCGFHVHKNCRESLSLCTKMKQQPFAPENVPGSTVSLRSKSSSSASSVSTSSSSSLSRDRWSAVPSPDDQTQVGFPRRSANILSFSTHSNLSKSISTSNIAGLDDVSLKGLKFLSHSTDNLNQGSKVNASTESLTDEGTEMMDSQLMGEFECDVKELEADSWSATVDKKFLKLHKKDEVKRQDVIYELFQTELHHVRTLRIMSEVYYKGLQKELQLDPRTLDKTFPMLDDLLETHTHFLTLLLERKRASQVASQSAGRGPGSFLITSIGDILVNQFSGCNADRMKKVYGKFCSRHNEAVNLYKELHAKDKRFQALIKRLMSSSIVRRLSIPECVLLVTQRITKYPVLIQRILQHTKDTDEDHGSVTEALRCVKELIAAVDSKVNEQEKKARLREVYSRTDSKSIMRMKSGQMFAREDLIRGRKMLHDGTLQLKNAAGRLKDVHAMLLSDVLVFLQEKDQKYVFASLDQRSTVISLQKLIVREVANEERGLFLITAGTNVPEMVNVLASSKDERNTWMSIIQDAMHCIEKEEDEGVPSETEEDRRQQENRAKEIRELLRCKDQQIVSLLEEKVHIFKDLCDLNPALDEGGPPIRDRMLFRATPDEVTKGEPIIKDALKEVESLHTLVNSGVAGAGGSAAVGLTGGSVGPVCLPRRAETFGGFDSHQMNSSKSGEKEEGDDALDLRRTESDSVLKKGANTSLQMLLKRNNEVQHSVGNLHNLLTSLQAVVVQQDTFIEDQRLALSERLAAQPSSRTSSSASSLSQASGSSSSSSRPSSLIEQEKQRSLERQRQEAASLQKQQAAHQEERRRREKEWEAREQVLTKRQEQLQAEEEAAAGATAALEEQREELQRRKEEYQRDLERLREAQRRLERDREALRRETERLEVLRSDESGPLQKFQRASSTTSEESLRFQSSSSLDQEPRDAPEAAKEVELSSSAPTKEPFLRIGSKRMGKNFNPFSSSSSSSTTSSSKAQGGDKDSQLPSRLLQLAKAKGKKDKKKKGKGEETGQAVVMSEPHTDGEVFFC